MDPGRAEHERKESLDLPLMLWEGGALASHQERSQQSKRYGIF